MLFDTARRAGRFGLRTTTLGCNYPSLMAWKDLAIRRTGAGGNQSYYEHEGIDTFQAQAVLTGPHTIDLGHRQISAAHILIATGAEVAPPAIPGVDTIEYLTPRSALALPRPPKQLLIVGGGSTAVEFTHLFGALGSTIHIVEGGERLLPGEDPEVGALMARLLHDRYGSTVLAEARVTSVEAVGRGGIRATVAHGDDETSLQVDQVLVTSGAAPRTDLGLDQAGVAYTQTGITVDEHLTTSLKHVYAAGAVINPTTPTHTALAESRVVAHNLLHPRHRLMPNYVATPRVTMGRPAVASVGLTEDECLRRDLTIHRAVAPLSVVARSNVADTRDGFAKLITDTRGVILGGTVVAPHADDIIQEVALAVRYNLTATDLAHTAHAFLSWSEAVRVAAAKLIR